MLRAKTCEEVIGTVRLIRLNPLSNSALREELLRSIMRVADRLNTEIGCLGVSPILRAFERPWTLMSELPHSLGNTFRSTLRGRARWLLVKALTNDVGS